MAMDSTRAVSISLALGMMIGAVGCQRMKVVHHDGPKPTPHAHKGGPPPHAPAHGYRRKHGYDYYPDAQVYRNRDSGTWFWIEGDGWKAGTKIPGSVVLDTGGPVSVELDFDTPYSEHGKVANKHPGKGKGKDKDRYSKVRPYH